MDQLQVFRFINDIMYNFKKDFPDNVHITTICHGNGNGDTEFLVGQGIIEDHACRNLVVWYGNNLVIQRFDSGAPRTDTDHVADIGIDLDLVIYLIRLVHRNNCPAKEVGDDVLGSECNGKTGDTCTS